MEFQSANEFLKIYSINVYQERSIILN